MGIERGFGFEHTTRPATIIPLDGIQAHDISPTIPANYLQVSFRDPVSRILPGYLRIAMTDQGAIETTEIPVAPKKRAEILPGTVHSVKESRTRLAASSVRRISGRLEDVIIKARTGSDRGLGVPGNPYKEAAAFLALNALNPKKAQSLAGLDRVDVLTKQAVAESKERGASRDELSIVALAAAASEMLRLITDSDPPDSIKQMLVNEIPGFRVQARNTPIKEFLLSRNDSELFYPQIGNWWNYMSFIQSLDKAKTLLPDQKPLSLGDTEELVNLLSKKFGLIKERRYLANLGDQIFRDRNFVPGIYQAKKPEDLYQTPEHVMVSIAAFVAQFIPERFDQLGLTLQDLSRIRKSFRGQIGRIDAYSYREALRLAEWQSSIDNLSGIEADLKRKAGAVKEAEMILKGNKQPGVSANVESPLQVQSPPKVLVKV